jgi:hypothetical protein
VRGQCLTNTAALDADIAAPGLDLALADKAGDDKVDALAALMVPPPGFGAVQSVPVEAGPPAPRELGVDRQPVYTPPSSKCAADPAGRSEARQPRRSDKSESWVCFRAIQGITKLVTRYDGQYGRPRAALGEKEPGPPESSAPCIHHALQKRGHDLWHEIGGQAMVAKRLPDTEVCQRQ